MTCLCLAPPPRCEPSYPKWEVQGTWTQECEGCGLVVRQCSEFILLSLPLLWFPHIQMFTNGCSPAHCF